METLVRTNKEIMYCPWDFLIFQHVSKVDNTTLYVIFHLRM